jgi:DNA modification methylase
VAVTTTVDLAAYRRFLEAKRATAPVYGFADVAPDAVHPLCKPHQRDIIRWAVRGGRRAIFAKFGLGKSIMQLETLRLVLAHVDPGAIALIIAPLGVRQEFLRDAALLGIPLTFIRTTAEIGGPGLYLTNYESVREGKLDVSKFLAVSLDEAAVLRGFGGTKTFREFMARIAGDDRASGRVTPGVPYRFVATATPSPNAYIEILAYAAFLGIMDVGEAKTRFFKRNSEKADELTLHPHKEEEFWLWVHTWAVFLQRPSELGYSDEGYDLPPLTVRWHPVEVAAVAARPARDGQVPLVSDPSGLGVQEAALQRRASLEARIARVRDLIAARPDEHVLIWHDLEDERRALEAAIPGLATVYGSQDLDEREGLVAAFADGAIPRLGGKPVMLGSGCNLQRHCAWAIFAGVDFKFNDFIQACHRIYRFLQTREVVIDIVHATSQAGVVKTLVEKWERHDAMLARMSEIIARYGLTDLSAEAPLARAIGVTRRELAGEAWRAVNADTVEETAMLAAAAPASVDLIITSIPFGTQYEYTPSYNDFGHTDDDAHFFAQMDFLSPSLLTVLRPGRVMAVHVKDRIRPGGLDGFGFQTASPFHAHTILHFQRHGFAYLGMITVVTDVVRENNQTYRLGWTEQCKDGSRMGVGMPEYVLLFRKPPTDASNGYADAPVVKSKAAYSRARWQIDAHAFWRSSGDRLLRGEDLDGLPADEVFRIFRGWSATHVYDHDATVAIGEALERAQRLPPGFMLLQPVSHHPDVWTDVARMRTMNTLQAQQGREGHLCPLQFDIVDRLIARYSQPGELVYDPFAGLMTVPLCAVTLGRRGLGVELNARYFDEGVTHLRAASAKLSAPSLLDLVDAIDALDASDAAEPDAEEVA